VSVTPTNDREAASATIPLEADAAHFAPEHLHQVRDPSTLGRARPLPLLRLLQRDVSEQALPCNERERHRGAASLGGVQCRLSTRLCSTRRSQRRR
jgi:hypothetical protein